MGGERVVVFGASGLTGRLVVDEGLARGWRVVAFVRSPEKLERTHERLEVVQGDATDPDAVARAVEGADAVISALGRSADSPPDLLTTFARNLLDATRAHGVERVVSLVGAGVHVPEDEAPSLGRRFMWLLMRLFARAILEDAQGHADLLRASDRAWTLARPPRLVDGPRTGRIAAAPYLSLGPSSSITRADLAAFLVEQVEDDRFVRKAPMVTAA